MSYCRYSCYFRQYLTDILVYQLVVLLSEFLDISRLPYMHASLLKTATKIAALERRFLGWKYLKSPKFLRFSVIVSVNESLQYSDVT